MIKAEELTTVEMFQPLIKKTKNNEEILMQYMFMYRDNKGRYYFKHKDTRDYIVLSKRGRLIKGRILNFVY